MTETDPLIEVDVHVNHPLPDGFDLDRLERLVVFALQAEEKGRGWAVAVVLVGDPSREGLRGRFINIPATRCCVAFPPGAAQASNTRCPSCTSNSGGMSCAASSST